MEFGEGLARGVAGLKSKAADPKETERRVSAALGKHERGEALTEKEELIVYWVKHGGGCHACCGVSVGVRRSDSG